MVSRFHPLGELGRGGGGVVQRVRDSERGETLALKRLHGVDAAAEAALRREHRLLQDLRHPCIVVPIELGRDAKGLYLLSPIAEGEDFLTHSGDSWERLATALPQLLSALRYLHERGLAHGDLSPANVRVRPDGRLALIDFGLAARIGDPRALIGGTEGFTAPERRSAEPAAAVDLYAAGALLARAAPTPRPEVLKTSIERLMGPAEGRPSAATLERSLLPVLGTVPLRTRERRGEESSELGLAGRRAFGELLAGRSVVLRGPSAIGKSSLLRALSDRWIAHGRTVLQAHPRPGSRAPFEVLDQLFEGAPAAVEQGGESARRVGRHSVAVARRLGTTPHALRTRAELRERLFDSTPTPPLAADVAAVLDHLESPLLVIDDLQWADSDSLSCLRALAERDGGQLLVASRPTRDRELPTAIHVDLPRWSPSAIRRLLGRRGLDAETAARVASDCEGLPGVALLAARFDATSLEQGVEVLVDGLSPRTKRALGLLHAAGEPLEGLDRGAVEELNAQGLTERRPGGVDVAHDVLREPIGRALGADWLRAAQLDLSRRPQASADARVRACLAMNDEQSAGELAATAAPELTDRGAYHAAAELWRVAARVDPTHRRSFAAALALVGRHGEAANQWAELARRGTARSRRGDRLAQAHALFAARRISEGSQVLAQALGRPEPAWKTWARFVAGPRIESPVLDQRGAELALRNASLAAYYDLRGGIRLALDARASLRPAATEGSAWADNLLAFFASFVGLPALARRYERSASARRLEEYGPILRAFPGFLSGYRHLRAGRNAQAARRFDIELATLADEPERHFFEVQLVESLRASAVLKGQRVPEAEAALSRFEAATRGTDGVALQVHLATARALSATWQGRFEEAVSLLERTRAEWPEKPRTVQHVLLAAYTALPRTLLGDGAGAHRELSRALRGHRSLFFSAYGPIVLALAAGAELAAARAGAPDASTARAVARAAIAARRPSWARGLALRVLAHQTPLGWARVEAIARADDQPIDLALARHARGRTLGREGATLRAEARARLAEVGARPRLLEEFSHFR